MRLFHCWLLHKWPKWKDTNNWEITRSKDGAVVGHLIVQERRCEVCNKVERRVARVWIA